MKLFPLSPVVLVVTYASLCFATISSGNYGISYSVTYGSEYASLDAFCSAWHDACVNYIGPLGQHHRLTCQTASNGETSIFCGGIWKDASGTWNSSQIPADQTKVVAAAENVTVTFFGECTASSGPSDGYDNSVSSACSAFAASSTADAASSAPTKASSVRASVVTSAASHSSSASPAVAVADSASVPASVPTSASHSSSSAASSTHSTKASASPNVDVATGVSSSMSLVVLTTTLPSISASTSASASASTNALSPISVAVNGSASKVQQLFPGSLVGLSFVLAVAVLM